ncbi:lipase [Bacillus sp. SA1-12]|uniref:alpha/beta hydrolase n=1 Tax=Bacillus sp. SA1-12 TaxID=1455638 RepID=UPI000626F591|nr:alpha/beta hydrolase [Bacillus sp. SA1-12]KKI90436.1 lipase [Bacillus sp. SA1-12]
MTKRIKHFFLLLVSILLVCSLIIIAYVEQWRETEAGIVPVKTAVLLHAVNQNLVSADTKAPKIFTRSGTPPYNRETIHIPMSDGEDIPIRIYEPKAEGPHPIILYYHGGAFMEGYGNIDTHDNIVRALASRTGSVVISVDYRLAPEYIYPTAVKDSYEALLWAVENAAAFHGDPTKLAVVGDSSGGNVATAVTMMARDQKGPEITAQTLFYPLTTFKDIAFSSRETYDSGYYLLSRSVMEMAREHYTPNEEMWNLPYASPLHADSLKNLPAALVITAEFDPLRDEGEAYGKRLAESGVPVKAIRYNGVMHGFVSFYEVMDRGNYALNEAVSYLNEAFLGGNENRQYNFIIYDNYPTIEALKERGEAYAIGGYLLGKQVVSAFSSWYHHAGIFGNE